MSARALLVWCAATDNTFVRSGEALVGKCIHCRRKLVIPLDGGPTRASVEHILPRNHGGQNTTENLAVACDRCNQQKGSRLDHRKRMDPTLVAVIERLQERRRARLRPPLEGFSPPRHLLPSSDEPADPTDDSTDLSDG